MLTDAECIQAATCEAAGLSQGYTSPSLRVGAAQALAGANISLASSLQVSMIAFIASSQAKAKFIDRIIKAPGLLI